ncbi:MAG TPA: hypothetical protein VEY91_10505 [Candidatus Limnocylindria bacterium]|nr:hypothetical protein [Candidatus Limnocylindria bacterium]
MNPYRVLSSALMTMVLWTAPVTAQGIDVAREALDLAPDPILRSPRLLGMGRLTLAADANNRITLWDFAAHPTGVLEDDSVSTLEFRPGTSSASSVHDVFTSGAARERQDLALRENRLGFEAWRRAETIAYGFAGDISTLRLDQPTSDQFERRSQFRQPAVMGVLNGRMPRIQSDRLRYALRILYANEQQVDQYRTFFQTPSGEYIDNRGEIVGPPDAFIPDERRTQTLGGGIALAYRFGSSLTAALGTDFTSSTIDAENSGPRHASEIRENRPYTIGQATLIGRVGPSFEWGADGRAWRSSSEQSWAFTLSSGIGLVPFSGRGKLLDRQEEGSRMRTRARWRAGSIELGAGFNTAYREIKTLPPAADDRTSFNHFRNTSSFLSGTDSLSFPDSVSENRSEERTWEIVVGGSWQPRPRTTVGIEYRKLEDRLDQLRSGAGPLRKLWDARGGLEHPLTEVLDGRLGYVYRVDDRDDFTRNNEFISHTVTLGAGLHPAQSSWTIEAGYAIEWLQPDYGDPGGPRESRQQLSTQVHWAF